MPIDDKDICARNDSQGQDEQHVTCCQELESSLSEQTSKLCMELKKKEDEIIQLKKLLSEAQQTNTQQQQQSSTEENHHDETTKDPNDDDALLGENQDAHQIRPYRKEIIFNGKKGKDQSSDLDKPSDNDIIQMHYTMEVLQYTKSTLQSKIELGSSKNTLTKVIMVEDSRKRNRNDYNNDNNNEGNHHNDNNCKPFEFILGQDQVTLQWEYIVREMYRGEVALIEMKFDSLDELDILSLFPDPLALMNLSNQASGEEEEKEVQIIGYGVKCRIELIDFWKYEKPFRPWIMTI